LLVKDLKTYFYAGEKTVKAVDGISFKINKGETLGLTGESGSGKTTVAFSILRLIRHLVSVESGLYSTEAVWGGEIVNGKILFKGRDLLKLSDEEMRGLRGKEISIIFQNPISSLNPMEIIGFQVGEPKEAHEKNKREKIREMVFDYLGKVDLAAAKKRYYHDPHLFSGGEGQRIMIAMALICSPSLLIADEPTSSLDVLVQRQILELIKRMKKEFDLSMLLLTHDLGIIAEVSDYVAVMYCGKVVEYGDVRTIFKRARHPYTKALIASTPRIDIKTRIKGISGYPPDPYNLPSGCRFHPRCEYATKICEEKEPESIEIGPRHFVSCLRASEIT